jgi:diguanylate cyclase (GGDEF)-like protein
MPQKLTARIVLFIALVALGLAALTSLSSYGWAKNKGQAEARRLITQLAETVRPTASIAVYLDNKELAKEVVSGLSGNELVSAVLLTSHTGLAAGDSGLLKARRNADWVRLALQSPFTANDTVGEMVIKPDQQVIDRLATEDAVVSALTLTLFVALVAAIVTRAVQQLFIRPLQRVATDLHDVVPGETVAVMPPVRHEQDEIGMLVGDINSLLQLVKGKLDGERALRADIERLERRFRLIFERASGGIFLLNREGEVVLSNSAFEEIFASCRVQAASQLLTLDQLFADSDAAWDMLHRAAGMDSLVEGDLMLGGEGDEPRWVHCLFSPVMDEVGGVFGHEGLVEVFAHDITERRLHEQEIRFEAEHDALTGLLNRRSGEQQLRRALQEAGAAGHCVAVGLLDLDGFKAVNDSHGHEAGDWVLMEVAKRLCGGIRGSDSVARLGGDEFLLVINDIRSREAVEAVAWKLLDRIREPIVLEDGRQVSVGASAGFVLADQGAGDFDALLALADEAMYQVKHHGKYGVEVRVACAAPP